MDPTIVFNGYENPDAFIIRYKTLERQQQHFNVSLFNDENSIIEERGEDEDGEDYGNNNLQPQAISSH